ncbi:hypothetical protein TDB9533_03448 [Thalassocella blandensis]|nr:hypothetical protein TDB9533_03448 [Thalassocella blandensis]
MLEHKLNQFHAHRIIIFDGECKLCESSVIFVIRHDKNAKFSFVQAQSPLGQALQSHYALHALDENTMILIQQQRAYTRSSAAVRIARELDGIWKLLALSWFIPLPLRNWAYHYIAKHRYRWFGRRSQCLIPDQTLESRFLSLNQEN